MTAPPVQAFLSLGSNLGDRREALQAALLGLERRGVRVVRRSSLYETAPIGVTDQPPFLNLAVEVATDLTPEELLAACRRVEDDLGRVRQERWGPRTVDIDILLYDRRTVRTADLEIPHPRLTERRFVLVPLLEIAPEAALPDGRSLRTVLPRLADQDVRRVAP